MSIEIQESKSLRKLSERLAEGNLEDDLRAVLLAAHTFKLGWAQLGVALLQVQSKKTYRNWGSTDFKGFCSKELGLRWGTVEKLLRSTYYMQRHEPRWLEADQAYQTEHPTPDLSAVNFLARGEEHQAIGSELRKDLHKEVFENGATGVKVGRLASPHINDAGRQALGMRPPAPEDPAARTALTATREVEKVVRGLKKAEAPEDVQERATALLEGMRRWKASLEEPS